MDRLARLFKAIETFAEHAYKKPIWYFATLACGSCLAFIFSYQSSRPEEQARFENAINERRVQIEDSKRMMNLGKEIVAEQEPVNKAFGQFQSIIQDIIASGQLTGRKQQIEENYRLSVEIRKRVEIIIAKLQGTNFRVAYLNEEVRTSEGFLKVVASALKWIEDVCASYLTDDINKFVQQIHQSPARSEGILKEGKTALAQSESQSLQLESAIRLKELELKRAVEQYERHYIKGLFQIPAAVISVGYLISVGIGIGRFWTNPNRVTQRSKRVGSISQKRRKKR